MVQNYPAKKSYGYGCRKSMRYEIALFVLGILVYIHFARMKRQEGVGIKAREMLRQNCNTKIGRIAYCQVRNEEYRYPLSRQCFPPEWCEMPLRHLRQCRVALTVHAFQALALPRRVPPSLHWESTHLHRSSDRSMHAFSKAVNGALLGFTCSSSEDDCYSSFPEKGERCSLLLFSMSTADCIFSTF